MQVARTDLSSTQVKLAITAEETELAPIKNQVLSKLAKDVKISGFREGTAPASLVEKSIDSQKLQTEFLDEALTQIYSHAAQHEKVRPVTRPDVQIKKFVPFTSLEFEVTTYVLGPIKLPDYKKVTVKKDKTASVTAKEVDDVISSLQKRVADKKDVNRASKNGDEVWIDFKGVNAKGEAIKGADGKDYPLILGSKSFIPGFEDKIVEMKANDEKTFTLTFPKDYGVKALAGKKVTFTVKVTKVQEVIEPEVNNEFAGKVGPFKTVDELKADIKKQLEVEKQRETDAKHQDEIVKSIVEKTALDIPEPLIEQQITYNIDELKRNLTYRSQTYQEFLEGEGLSEEQYKKTILEPTATRQLKTSMVLSEIAQAENLNVTPEELEIRLKLLKGQHKSDPKMQAELDKPENRRDIASRMLTEKVLQILTSQ